MLRKMLGSHRRRIDEHFEEDASDDESSGYLNETSEDVNEELLEPWTEWISRTTHSAEEHALGHCPNHQAVAQDVMHLPFFENDRVQNKIK